jgi:hypothetical protein
METWSEREYADPVPYLRHRAEVIVSLGPTLQAGDRLCDLACGDGGLADFLPGIEYLGVDADPKLVEEARSKGREVVHADLNEFEPPEPVAATSIFRAIYYTRDRRDFLRRLAGYTERSSSSTSTRGSIGSRTSSPISAPRAGRRWRCGRSSSRRRARCPGPSGRLSSPRSAAGRSRGSRSASGSRTWWRLRSERVGDLRAELPPVGRVAELMR